MLKKSAYDEKSCLKTCDVRCDHQTSIEPDRRLEVKQILGKLATSWHKGSMSLAKHFVYIFIGNDWCHIINCLSNSQSIDCVMIATKIHWSNFCLTFLLFFLVVQPLWLRKQKGNSSYFLMQWSIQNPLGTYKSNF